MEIKLNLIAVFLYRKRSNVKNLLYTLLKCVYFIVNLFYTPSLVYFSNLNVILNLNICSLH